MRDAEASATARGVAAHRLAFERVPSHYGRPEDDQRLQADVAAGVTGTASALTRYLQVRTLFFDRIVVAAIDAGVGQIVAVGAGYDGRSLRYAKPGVRWFELDHPDTQAVKRRRLDRLGIAHAETSFASADFARDDVALALAGAGQDSGQDTLFICEGVSAYLGLDVVASLLASLRQRAAPGSQLAVEFALEPVSDAERDRRARLAESVAGLGEPLVSAAPRADLVTLLAGGGWRLVRAHDPAGGPLEDSARSTAFVVAAAG